jgi:integrase/recombinase XerD
MRSPSTHRTAARLRAYLTRAGHGGDRDGPLFRPLRPNGERQDIRGVMDPEAIDRVVRFAARHGLDRGYSAHSMHATFITAALENGAQLEDVQKAAGHRDPGTTKLYDRRGYNMFYWTLVQHRPDARRSPAAYHCLPLDMEELRELFLMLV